MSLDELLSHPLVVVTGKGGTGKSTVAAALGLAAARRGRRTIVAEVARRDDVSRALAGASGGRAFVERTLADGLAHISIDPQSAMDEYLDDQLPGPLAELLSGSRVFGLLAAATPGMRELLTVGKVWELAQAQRRTRGGEPYDLVVLDAPATGHGVAVLTAPRTFAEAARVGPVARQGRTIHEMLADPARTAVVAVARAEEMPVNETLALREALGREMGLPLARAVVNGVLPARFSAADATRVAEGLAPSSHARRAALAGAARSRAQRAQVARLRRGLGAVPVQTLPHLFVPEVGAAELERLSKELERR
ncbi:ArsA-related P-loop ATPase [Conexibacter sp. SYSU D00693]|uniref:ArsA family ATPase n=1 Tax=Conexibacter sp. SYSU D00693 TaxID=2812560 RepID=UPI00196AC309|nr:ArsA-related P-loop ATPase [Conexibacter sp. SYSU D00693]